jgi:hypothetical protein
MEIIEFYLMSETHREEITRKLTPQIHSLSMKSFFSCGNTFNEYVH